MGKKHKHEYEPYLHPGVSPQAEGLGIQGIELSRCRGCQKEMVRVMTKDGWVPLLEERERGEQDILLA